MMTEERFTCDGKGVCWVIIDNERKRMVSSASDIIRLLNKQDKEIERLKGELFEVKCDYLIETSDVSDKIYLEDEIDRLKFEIFGVD